MYYCIFPIPGKKGEKKTEIEIKILKMKRYLLKLANSFHQFMSDTDKQRHFLIFMRS